MEAQSGNERVTPATFSRVRAALEEAGVVFIPDGVRRRPAGRGDVRERFHKLRGISLCSAARLQGREKLANADLYDENGLPA
ncbi:MAG: hypothetical protein ACREFT_18990 [Acetobacteraceae bacterium]